MSLPADRDPSGEPARSQDKSPDHHPLSDVRLWTVVEQSPLSVHIVAPDGTSLLTNESWQVLWDLPESAPAPNVFEDERLRRSGLTGYIEECLQSGELVVTPQLYYEPAATEESGPARWFRAFVHPVLDGERRTTQVALLVEDVTEAERSRRRLAVQHAVSRLLVEPRPPEGTVPEVLAAIGQGLGWELATFWRVEEEAGELRCEWIWRAEEGTSEEFAKLSRTVRFGPGVGFPGRVWELGEPVWVPDLHREDGFVRLRVARAGGLRAVFAFPVLVGAEVVGVVELFKSRVQQADEELVQTGAALGDQIGQYLERRRTEDRLRRSERRFRRLVEQAADAVFVHDLEGNFVEVNEAACASLGYTREELLNMAVPDVEQNLTEGGFAEILARRLASPPVTVDGIHRRKDGSTFPVEVRIGPLEYESGEPLLLALVRDVTERRRYERDLRRFKLISDNANDAYFLVDSEGGFLYVNKVACERLGYSEEELLSLSVPELDPLFGAAEYAELFERARREYVPPFDTVHRRKDGTEFPVEVSVNTVTLDGEPRLFATVRDITERKQFEESLRESEARLQFALESGRMGDWELDLETLEARRSLRHDRIFGYESLLPRWSYETFLEHVHPEDRGFVSERFERSLRTGEDWEFECRITRADGAMCWIWARGSLHRDASGRPTRMLGLVNDITERKQTEQERERLLESEREARMRLAFLSEASRKLAASLDYETTLSNLAELIVPRLADWCVVDTLQEAEDTHRVLVAYATPTGHVRQLRDRQPDGKTPAAVREVIRTGEPLLVSGASEEQLPEIVRNEADPELLRSLGLYSCTVVPLKTPRQILGTVTFVSAAPQRRYDADDLAFQEALASRAVPVIENARLYTERNRVAQTLQRSLLPPTLPEVPGVEVGAAFHPAGDGTEIGGDFYDLFRVPNDDWAILIGDVVGKGAGAATLTALARYTIRAAVMKEERPSRVLDTLNEAVLQQSEMADFCTAVFARLQVSRSPLRLTCASGGHPLPVLLRRSGSVEPIGEHGPLLGVYPEPHPAEAEVELRPGDAAVFYTDGVTEARGVGGALFGEERFYGLLRSCRGLGAQEAANKIEQTVLEYQGGYARDDIAVLFLRIPG